MVKFHVTGNKVSFLFGLITTELGLRIILLIQRGVQNFEAYMLKLTVNQTVSGKGQAYIKPFPLYEDVHLMEFPPILL